MNPSALSFNLTSQFDKTSVEGKFIWRDHQVEDRSLPSLRLPHLMREWQSPTGYLYFVSLRMLEKAVFQHLLSQLPCHPSIIATIQHFKVKITENERKLLAEINHRHCEDEFGSQEDFRNDFLVEASDLRHYLNFLSFCCQKVSLKCPLLADKSGFLRVEETNFEVTFVKVDGDLLIPLFYLEGETEAVQTRTVSGWDWLYLRFCGEYQGLRDELLPPSSGLCVALSDLKKLLPSQTLFSFFWPQTNHLRKPQPQLQPQPKCKKYEGSLQPIKDYPKSEDSAYQISSIAVSTQELQCINFCPFQFNFVLVALPHFVSKLFPRHSDDQVGRVFNRLSIVIYKGNTCQRKLMETSGWVENNEEIPLVSVIDILAKFEDIKRLLK